jgi:hypothetical protein
MQYVLMICGKVAEDQKSDTDGSDFFFLLTFPLNLFKVRFYELRTGKYINKFIGQLVVAQL